MPWRRTKVHLAGLLTVGLLVIAIALTAYVNVRDYEKTADDAEHARRALTITEALLSDLKDAETGERGYLLTHNPRYLEPYTASLPRIRSDLAQLTEPSLADADPAAVSQLRSQVAGVLTLLSGTVGDQQRGSPANATAINRADSAKAAMDSIRVLAERLTRAEQKRLDVRTASLYGRRKAVRILLLGGTTAILLFLAAFGVFINRLVRARDRLIEDSESSRALAQSERDRLETTLQSIGDAVIVTDAGARVTLMNRVAAKLTGWSPGESIGMEVGTVFPILNAQTGTLVANPVSRVLTEGVVVGLANHTLLRNRSGQTFPIDDSGAPIRNSAGTVCGAVLVFRDVTERYRAHRELEDAEERYRLMFENNPQPMWVYDIETLRFLAVNHAAIAQYGYSHDEFAAITLKDIRPEEDIPALLADVHRSPDLHRDGPWRHRRKDGSLFFVDIIVHPLAFMGRDARLVIANDVTERVKAESAVRDTTERLGTIVNTAPLAMWTLDLEGRVTSWNPAATEIFGWSCDEVMGRPLAVLPDKNQHEFDDLLAQYQSGDRIAAVETTRQRKDGRTIPVTLWSAPLTDHERHHTGTLVVVADISQRKHDERALAQSEAGFRLLFENNPQPMWVFHAENFRFLEVNQAAVSHYGYSREEFLAMRAIDVRSPEEAERFERRVGAGAATTPQNVGIWQHRLKNGKIIEVEIVAHRLEFRGEPAILSALTDVTQKKTLEDQLRRSQKLEAVGRLAGGVAHDFNNLLTVIIGYADMLKTQAAPDSRERTAVSEIGMAAERASSLTRQLLAFSRQQVLKPKALDLNQSIRKIEPMLSRLIGENIQIVTDLTPELWTVSADPGQIDQIIVNLAVNARDAMAGGGKLTIQTSKVVLTEEYSATHLGVSPGEYVLISVSDTGHGMDAETRAHIFEPFFTTKESGRGTGLGLATVYGIVKQSGGDIWVYSELGIGTSINVYLPRLASQAEAIETVPGRAPQQGTESVLLVEDEEVLRHLITRMLEMAGYTVHPAANVDEALAICEDRSVTLHLLLTDLVLTRGTGWDIAAKAIQMRPGLKILFMSGYSESAAFGERSLDASVNFIQKPFNAADLRAKVREILDMSQTEGR